MKNYMQIAEVERFLSTELNDAGYGGSDIQKTPVGLKITIFSIVNFNKYIFANKLRKFVS